MAEAPTGPPSKVSRRFHPGWRTLLPSCLRQAGEGMGWGGYHGSVSGQRPNTNKIHACQNEDKHTLITCRDSKAVEIMEKHTVRNTNTAPKAMRSMLCSDITLVESLPHLVGKPHGPCKADAKPMQSPCRNTNSSHRHLTPVHVPVLKLEQRAVITR